MVMRNALAVGAAALLGAVTLAGDKPATKSCCAKPAAKEEAARAEKLRCTLTGKVVDKCCCVEREGKTHCTLADKEVASCCCTPAESEAKAGQQK